MNGWHQTIKRTTPDTWTGIALLFVATVYWMEAGKIRSSALDDPVGASGLPKALAYVLGGLSLWLIVRSVLDAKSRVQIVEPEELGPPAFADGARPHLRALGMLAIGTGYLLLLPYLGYGLTITVLLLAVSLYSGANLNLRTILVAAVGGCLCQLLFVQFLGIAQPSGKLLSLTTVGS